MLALFDTKLSFYYKEDKRERERETYILYGITIYKYYLYKKNVDIFFHKYIFLSNKTKVNKKNYKIYINSKGGKGGE